MKALLPISLLVAIAAVFYASKAGAQQSKPLAGERWRFQFRVAKVLAPLQRQALERDFTEAPDRTWDVISWMWSGPQSIWVVLRFMANVRAVPQAGEVIPFPTAELEIVSAERVAA